MKNVIVFDTETTGDLENPVIYDFGYCILDIDSGAILQKRRFIIEEIFYNDDLMKEAYYFKKTPQYWKDIINNKLLVVDYESLCKILRGDFKRFDITESYAYNAMFDHRAIKTTRTELNSDNWLLPYSKKYCILRMARRFFADDEMYADYCKTNGFMTKHKTPRPQTTAETVFSYLNLNPTFTEEHTALDDSIIESEILMFLLRNYVPKLPAYIFKTIILEVPEISPYNTSGQYTIFG